MVIVIARVNSGASDHNVYDKLAQQLDACVIAYPINTKMYHTAG